MEYIDRSCEASLVARWTPGPVRILVLALAGFLRLQQFLERSVYFHGINTALALM